jgi:hypothetical protein
VLNAAEAQHPLTITGTSTGAVGQTVTVGLNGAQYTGTVAIDGTWSVTVPQPVLVSSVLPDGTYTVTSNVSDGMGDTSSASRTFSLDTIGPQIKSFTTSDPSLTNANTVQYQLTFSEAVTGVSIADFDLVTTGVSGASIASVTPVVGSKGAQYMVAVNTGTGNGTIALELAGATFQDIAGNPVPGGAFLLQPSTYPSGTRPIYITTGDLNGDGKLDVVVANVMDNTVSVLLGNGDGTFQSQTTYGTGPNPDSVAIWDVNGDGRADLVVGNQSKNSQGLLTVSILLGNGDGTFQPQITNRADAGGFSVAVGDLNGDGIPDIAVPNIWSNTVSVLLGNGNGTFRNPITISTGVSPFGVAIGDLNGDGKLDLVVSNETSKTLSVLLGNGDGTFEAQTTYATGSSPNVVAIGDLNRDGKPDLKQFGCCRVMSYCDHVGRDCFRRVLGSFPGRRINGQYRNIKGPLERSGMQQLQMLPVKWTCTQRAFALRSRNILVSTEKLTACRPGVGTPVQYPRRPTPYFPSNNALPRT